MKQGKKQGLVGIEGGRVLGHKLPGDESHQQHPRNEGKIAWLWTTEGMARDQGRSWCTHSMFYKGQAVRDSQARD